MAKPTGIAAGVVLLALLVMAGIAGAALVHRAAGMPEHTDPAEARRIYEAWPRRVVVGPEGQGKEQAAHKADWSRRFAALETPKWRLHDLGRGLLALAVCGLAVALRLRLWDIRNLRHAKTPRSALSFLLLGSLVWLAMVPVQAFRFHEDVARWRVSPWSDVPVPVVAAAAFYSMTLPVLVGVGWLTVLRRAKLPANLWLWDPSRWRRSAAWTGFYGVLALLLSADLVLAIIGGPFPTIPLLMTGVYLVLSARAATVSQRPPGKRGQPSKAWESSHEVLGPSRGGPTAGTESFGRR